MRCTDPDAVEIRESVFDFVSNMPVVRHTIILMPSHHALASTCCAAEALAAPHAALNATERKLFALLERSFVQRFCAQRSGR